MNQHAVGGETLKWNDGFLNLKIDVQTAPQGVG